MEEDNKQTNVEDNFKVSENKKTKGKKAFIIKYIIFVILLAGLTGICIYLNIKNLNEKIEEYKQLNATEEVNKKEAEDRKYLVDSYAETYNSNSIKIIHYYDIDGTITKDTGIFNNSESNYEVMYLQIEGLKNKSIQNKINQKLRQSAYDAKGAKQKVNVYSYLSANFSNVISVNIWNDEGVKNTLNIDLSTGDNIKLEDLFISSAPINSYIADALYEVLAWQNSDIDIGDGDVDMKKVDTSEYEDKFLMIINNYKKNKDKLEFDFSANYINIYNLIDKNIINKENTNQIVLTINLTKYIDEVAMYKKYLTKESIFEDDSIGNKGTVVFTNDDDYITRLSYGKVKDNVFLEEVVLESSSDYYSDEQLKPVRDYIDKLSKETREEVMKEDKNGMFCQVSYGKYQVYNEDFFQISVTKNKATCSKAYFKNDAFLDYIKMKSRPVADASLRVFEDFLGSQYPNLKIYEREYKTYYVSKDGKLLGETEEEAKNKIHAQNQETNKKNNKPDKVTDDVNLLIQNNIVYDNLIENGNTVN